MDIGKRLKQIRESRHLSLNDVASAVGVSRSTVLRWENGQFKSMGNTKIEALAKVLRISPMFIVLGDDAYLDPNVPTLDKLSTLFNKMTMAQKEMLIKYAEFILEENNE